MDILRTKKVLKVNPTVSPNRTEAVKAKIILYGYDKDNSICREIKNIEETFDHISTPQNTWINIDGLRKEDVEKISAHFGIHQLIAEDILSIGQRPKMDELNGLIFCMLNMLYFNEKDSSVETEQIRIVLG